MDFEFELKFRATPEILAKIQQEMPDGEIYKMRTTYYDTQTGDFSAKKMTLRCRQENDTAVCTLKTPAGELGRGEFEIKCGDIQKALPKLCKLSGIEQPLSDVVAVCGAEFTRIAKTIPLPDCTVELALDRGIRSGGGREVPLYELEVELKSGSQEGAIAYANALSALYGLVPEGKSKFCRALELAKGEYYG